MAEKYPVTEYQEETLWRITEEDIHDALVEHDIPQEEWADWYDKFRAKFTIDDWQDWVRTFIAICKD
jgi:hypothetical protein